MFVDKPFTKENLDMYLKELAKEFRKNNGNKMPAEIILIGGASILINYGFREMTYDMDAIINSSSAMKDAINIVGDRFGLPLGWINTDFMNTNSYTPRLVGVSKYYKTFSNILQIRTVSAEYLVAMKLMAGRQYKNDLYDEYELIPYNSRSFIEAIYKQSNLKDFYRQCREMELDNKDVLVEFQDDYPGELTEDNLENILNVAREKKMKEKLLGK